MATKCSFMGTLDRSLTRGSVASLVKMPGLPGDNAPERFPRPVTTLTTSVVVETRIAIGPPPCNRSEFNSTFKIRGVPFAGAVGMNVNA